MHGSAETKITTWNYIDGAWLPEPWASRLVQQAGAQVLVDEKYLWDGTGTGKPGEVTSAHLIRVGRA